MKRYLLPPEGRFYKANLHCHTTVSDGALTPQEIKALYKANGYSVVAFTDHCVMVDHSYLNDADFLALKGYEIPVNSPECKESFYEAKTYHLNLLAKRREVSAQVCFDPSLRVGNSASYIPFVRYVGETEHYVHTPDCVNRILAEAQAHGFLVSYAHPQWSLHTEADYMPLQGLFGVEVFNGNTTCNYGVYDDSPEVFARMAKDRPHLVPLAVDDNHNAHPAGSPYCDSFLGFQMIKAPALSYEAIIDALVSGHSYASSGPLLHALYIEDGTVHALTSPVTEAVYATPSKFGQVFRAGEGEAEHIVFPLATDYPYFRLELRDARGRRAYTGFYAVKDAFDVGA